jgi:hypothetical protein
MRFVVATPPESCVRSMFQLAQEAFFPLVVISRATILTFRRAETPARMLQTFAAPAERPSAVNRTGLDPAARPVRRVLGFKAGGEDTFWRVAVVKEVNLT